MYYRRKLLLALLEIFGGELGAVDCYKLMLLYCQHSNQNHYDFFPYKYGAWSIILYQDKLRLTDLGYLEAGENFRIRGNKDFYAQLDSFSQAELRFLHENIGKLRGNDLLRKAYLDYPFYALRSHIAPNILSDSEYQKVLSYQNHDSSSCLFTIGYEGISIDKYLSKLISSNISTLVDVRKNPISKKYGFSKNQLKRHIENIDIQYVHFPELGVPSNLRQNLNNEHAYKNLFREYEEVILRRETQAIGNLRDLIYTNKRVALTCFEASYECCHRSKITEYFENDSSFQIPIIHL